MHNPLRTWRGASTGSWPPGSWPSTDLPPPRANVLIEGHLVDFAWPEHRLIVELDGFAFHTDHESFEDDRKRDTDLQKKGWRVLRITYRRLHSDPAGVIADVRHMLNQ